MTLPEGPARAAVTHPFSQVNVFSAQPLAGNPVAVVHGADGLTEEQMAAFARWTNLSETTFLLTPTDPAADYRLRIFTPGGELPFAGHPTLGSAHAWLAAGGRPATEERVVQECAAGLITLRREQEDGPAHDAGRLAFAAPPLVRSGPVDPADVHRALTEVGLEPDDLVDAAWVDNGPGWMGLLLTDADAVLRAAPQAGSALKIGLMGPHLTAQAPADVEVRAFVPGLGIPEDPVTGSLNAGLAQWLIGAGRLPARYVAAQGTVLARAGRVHVEQDATDPETIWVGGDCVTVLEGTVRM
ncbi:PhzF family phenazine biosynthesis protein [Citricoccus sp. I39-566]|uniref:PhzF family phenazine biosynthesis protein n=1 Tax=Citricoccus sp. I39-566 TaxID=3073268 RepID=UPI00286CD462|nr:PhzF family phenazine biosynthesis protein [Citricoccus sp. I39-566]WMY78716.1 PhzF family phenazine biosynthesis protein [Citricoccus sp. I39-566]